MPPIDIAKYCEDHLAHELGLGLHVLKSAHFDKKHPQHLYAVCLYARIFDLACACKALLEKKAFVGLPPLLRGMFEADVALRNVLKSPDFFKRMYAAFLKEKQRMLILLKASMDVATFLKIDGIEFGKYVQALKDIEEALKKQLLTG